MKHMFLEISNMASNTIVWEQRAGQPQMLTELTSLVRKLAVGQPQPSIAAKVCGICTSMEHPIDMWPTLQEIELDHVESIVAIGPSQGPYAAQRFGSAPNAPQGQNGQAELTRVNKRSLSRDEVILVSPTPSRQDQSRLGNPCLAAQQPSREAQLY
ncbi:hypothetical protein CR513_10709, partial [Mucuna pruriens]